MTVVLVGGTGRLGHALAETLVARGEPVRALVRSGKRAGHLRALGIELEVGDLLDPRSLRRLLDDARVVVTAAQGDPLSRQRAALQVDSQGNQNLISAASTAGIEQFIFISALHADSAPHSVTRLYQKQVAEEYLRTSGMRYTIVRPATFLETFAPNAPLGRIVERFGVGLLPSSGNTLHSFCAVADVARATAAMINRPEAYNQVVPIGGAEDLSYREAFQRIERLFARRMTLLPCGKLTQGTTSLAIRAMWPNLPSMLKWSQFLERVGGTCTMPIWLADELGTVTRFNEGIRQLYRTPSQSINQIVE